MRWVRTPKGERAHVLHEGLTLCGMRIEHVTEASAEIEKCGNCDKEWRRRGREKRKKRGPYIDHKTSYRPRNTFKDWDV